jgi:hypothetical protein
MKDFVILDFNKTRKIILIALCLISTSVYSLELKLQCSITSINQSPSMNKGGNIIFEINDTEVLKKISTTSNVNAFDKNVVSVPTQNMTNTKRSFIDNSNTTKWDITNVSISRNNDISEVNIKIDRNIGNFYMFTKFISSYGNSTSNANGVCEEIDTTRIKF